MASVYTVKQVAKILGYSTNTIYTFLKEGRLVGMRVGRGRFLIPQSEINNLLKVEGKDVFRNIVPTEEVLSARLKLPCIGRVEITVGNIFDWFVGAAAFIAGLAMFLYNHSFNAANMDISPVTLWIIRIVITGSGLGILFSNIFEDPRLRWRKIFKLLLAAAGTVMVYYLWLAQDLDGVLIFSSLVLILFISTFLTIRSLVLFGAFISFLAVSAPISIFLARQDTHIVEFFNFFGNPSPDLTLVIFSFLASLFLIFFWYGYFRSRVFFGLASWFAGATFLVMGFQYGVLQYWSRSFLLLIIAFTTFLLPAWDYLTAVKKKKIQIITVATFIAIFFLLLVSVLMVGIIQLNVKSTIEKEDLKKVEYARDFVSNAISAIKFSLSQVAMSTDLIKAVEKKDREGMTAVIKPFFVSNKNLRRVLIFDKDGKGISIYPFGSFDVTDYSFRDYFKAAKASSEPYVSDVFESLIDESRRDVIAVAVQIADSQGNFLGVLAVSVNLETIGFDLQKTADSDRGEIFEIIDSKGKFLIHTQTQLVGTKANATDPILKDFSAGTGRVASGFSSSPVDLIAYTNVPDLYWRVGLVTHIGRIYEMTSFTSMLFLSIILISILVGATLLNVINGSWVRYPIGAPSP